MFYFKTHIVFISTSLSASVSFLIKQHARFHRVFKKVYGTITLNYLTKFASSFGNIAHSLSK